MFHTHAIEHDEFGAWVVYERRVEADFGQLALDDEMGRKLQDIDLVTRKRAPKSKGLDSLDKKSFI